MLDQRPNSNRWLKNKKLFISFCFQFKIQFDDSLTACFEYPSESSLMIDESFGDEDEVDQNFYGRSSASPTSKLLNSVPLGEWIFPGTAAGDFSAVVLPFLHFKCFCGWESCGTSLSSSLRIYFSKLRKLIVGINDTKWVKSNLALTKLIHWLNLPNCPTPTKNVKS